MNINNAPCWWTIAASIIIYIPEKLDVIYYNLLL